jgi:hypothetical protein
MVDPIWGLCPPKIFRRKIFVPRGILTSMKGRADV